MAWHSLPAWLVSLSQQQAHNIQLFSIRWLFFDTISVPLTRYGDGAQGTEMMQGMETVQVTPLR